MINGGKHIEARSGLCNMRSACPTSSATIESHCSSNIAADRWSLITNQQLATCNSGRGRGSVSVIFSLNKNIIAGSRNQDQLQLQLTMNAFSFITPRLWLAIDLVAAHLCRLMTTCPGWWGLDGGPRRQKTQDWLHLSFCTDDATNVLNSHNSSSLQSLKSAIAGSISYWTLTSPNHLSQWSD